MRTVSIGPCACCGGAGLCPPLYITVQGTQTSLTQSGSTWTAVWNVPTTSLHGTAIPADPPYLATAQYVPFVKRSSTDFFPETSWANWLCVVNNQINIQHDLTLTQQSLQADLWTDCVVTFVFVCESSQFSAAISAFQANLDANIIATMGVLTTI
jgi:hypothetical protein